MNISDTCNAAADLIEVRGWRFGGGWLAAMRGEGELCLEGALMAADDVDLPRLYSCPAYNAVRDYLEVENPWEWNDNVRFAAPFEPFSNKAMAWAAEQVIATLRAVAVIHAAREDETATVERDAASVTA